MDTLPLVSILIPTYNRVGFLKESLESARKQTYPHLEIVVSDNASTDQTAELAKTYREDPRVRWHRNRGNLGLAGNWQILIYELARGDYAKILADDDYLANPDHIQQAVDLISQHHVDVVFAGAGSFDHRSGLIVDRSWDLPSVLTPTWWMEHLGDRTKGKTLFPNLTTNGVFHLNKAKALRAFIEPVFGMDYQLGFELMLSGPSGYLKGIHGIERKHPDNDGLNASLDVVMTSLKLYHRIIFYGQAHGLSDKPVREFCVRFMEVMTRGFILYRWGVERGTSLHSLWQLYQTLRQVDPALARRVLGSPTTIARFFLGGSPKRQEWLRQLYYRLNRWRQ